MVINFEPLCASLHVSNNAGSGAVPVIRMDIRPARVSVRTHKNKSLNEIRWSIEFRRDVAFGEGLGSSNAVGSLSYFPPIRAGKGFSIHDEDECISACVCLDDANFLYLSRVVLAERLPKRIRLSLIQREGVDFSSEHSLDFDIVWNIKAAHKISIERAEIDLIDVRPVVESDNSNEIRNSLSALIEVQSAQTAYLSLLRKDSFQIVSRLGYVIAIAGFVGIIPLISLAIIFW